MKLKLNEMVYNSIQRNPENRYFHGYRPSDYIKSPDQFIRKILEK